MERLASLFTDVEGSTALIQRVEEGLCAQLLAGHPTLIRSEPTAAHDGTVVDAQWDAFFAVFSSPRAYVTAGLELQPAPTAHARPAGEQFRVRIGIHTGEAVKTATGLVGWDVHRASVPSPCHLVREQDGRRRLGG